MLLYELFYFVAKDDRIEQASGDRNFLSSEICLHMVNFYLILSYNHHCHLSLQILIQITALKQNLVPSFHLMSPSTLFTLATSLIGITTNIWKSLWNY